MSSPQNACMSRCHVASAGGGSSKAPCRRCAHGDFTLEARKSWSAHLLNTSTRLPKCSGLYHGGKEVGGPPATHFTSALFASERARAREVLEIDVVRSDCGRRESELMGGKRQGRGEQRVMRAITALAEGRTLHAQVFFFLLLVILVRRLIAALLCPHSVEVGGLD